MTPIRDDLCKLFIQLGLNYELLDKDEAITISKLIRKCFGEAGSVGAIWEELRNETSYYADKQSEGLDLLYEMASPITLLIDDWSGYSAMRIFSGIAFRKVLSEMYGFVWYAVDKRESILICQNDHEFVLVCKT